MLAIHGLNRDATNADFLIAPLLAATRLSTPVTGYMATPTPNGANQEGTLGVVADTQVLGRSRLLHGAVHRRDHHGRRPDAEIRYTHRRQRADGDDGHWSTTRRARR